MEIRDNVCTYIRFKGDCSFKKMAFNEVDAMIFALLSYVDFRGILDQPCTLIDAYRRLLVVEEKGIDNSRPHMSTSPDLLEMVKLMANSVRFHNIVLDHYVDEYSLPQSEQFAALMITFMPRFHVFSFRGTDDSLAGWKENWEMIYKMPVSGQIKALAYIQQHILSKWYHSFDHYWLVGHSKGGNLAVYGACCLEEKQAKKIAGIYNFDGPGFRFPLTNFPHYTALKSRIHSYTPSFSVIGMTFEYYHKDYTIQSFEEGLGQHLGFSWVVCNDHFVRSTRDEESKQVEELFHSWLSEIPLDEREQFVQSLFEVLEQAKITNLQEFLHMDMKAMIEVVKAMGGIDGERRNLIIRILTLLVAKSAKPRVERLSENVEKIGNALSLNTQKIIDKFSKRGNDNE
ncbi:Mbeg1-like protein [uncultured Sharpea sp.]|uniref:Mbeg1-like protein n=1 Tax=uncultured Sharpea sp. TaxID=1112738 RepID=UPI00258A1D15|nr:Mbeg1-like protein [uncultured Sharpea sp.]